MKKCYIYLCLDGASPVIEAQVVDHLRLVREFRNNLSFDLFLLGRSQKGKSPSLFNPSRKKELERQIGGRLFARTFSNTLSGFFLTLYLLFRYTFPVCLTRNLIIHARAKDGGLMASIFKWLCLGLPRIIYDVRGEHVSEHLEAAQAARNPFKLFVARLSVTGLKWIEWFNLRSASRVLYVTDALRKVVESRYPFARRSYGGTFPSLSDTRKFFFDPVLRTEMREKLGFAPDQPVFLYAGGLQWYQCIEEMIELFKLSRELDGRVCFLFITDQSRHEEIRQRLRAVASVESFRVMQVPHAEIYGYLNVGDLGLLLRRPSVVNRCAAPTKFAEYLMCGLPIVLTKGIGDYSGLVEKENLGIVADGLNNLSELAKMCLQYLEAFRNNENRKRIAEIGARKLSRTERINDYLRILTSM